VNVDSDGDIAWSLGISAAEVFLGLARVLIILIFDDKCILFCSYKYWTGDIVLLLEFRYVGGRLFQVIWKQTLV
jgi:hypothetical protein